MKFRPKQFRLPLLLLPLSASLAFGLLAREYPLFAPGSEQNFVFQLSAVSDQINKGSSTARIRLVQKTPEEKFAFLRLEYDVKSGAGSFAGVRFNINDTKLVTDADVSNAILLRLRLSNAEAPFVVTLRDDRGNEASYDLKNCLPQGNGPWKYYEIPFTEFHAKNRALRPILDSITLLSLKPGSGTIDIAMVGINAP